MLATGLRSCLRGARGSAKEGRGETARRRRDSEARRASSTLSDTLPAADTTIWCGSVDQNSRYTPTSYRDWAMRATSHMELNRMNCNSGLPVAIRRARPEELRTKSWKSWRMPPLMHANGNPGQWRDGYPGRERIAADIAGGYSHAAIDAAGTMSRHILFHALAGTQLCDHPRRRPAGRKSLPCHPPRPCGTGPGIAARCMAWCLENRTVTCVRIPTATTSRCSVCCFGSVSIGRHRLRGGRHTAHRFRTQRQLSLQNSKRRAFPSYSPPLSSPSVTPASPQPLRAFGTDRRVERYRSKFIASFPSSDKHGTAGDNAPLPFFCNFI